MTALLSIVNKILIFAKSPIKGKVKTRLKKDTPLSDDDILKLYTAFLKDTIVSASLSKAKKIYIAYYPEDSKNIMLSVKSAIRIPQSTIELFPQLGNDFDKRLTNALGHIFPHPPLSPKGRGKRGGDNIVILGSDSPHIQPSTINRAFSFLSTPHSKLQTLNSKGAMVLGPSGEGGVYLIGVKGSRGVNFKGIFTSGNESDNLLKIARRRKMPLLILEELTDVDVKSDLITLISNLSIMEYSSHHTKIHLPRYTLSAIKKLGLAVDRKGDGTRGKFLSLKK
jgi:glycosyltransferase A (GT-A) superfamily protein (DUF2064 family)